MANALTFWDTMNATMPLFSTWDCLKWMGLTLLRRWREAGQANARARAHGARQLARKSFRGLTAGLMTIWLNRSVWRNCLARLRALIRRSSGQSTPELRCGPLVARPAFRQSNPRRRGGEADQPTNFRVLSYLMHHSQRLVSQGELTEHIYSQDFDRDSNTVESVYRSLAAKVGSLS